MGVFSRLSDIINANLNAALEKAEDPEKMIRLMIQEMEDTLVEIRSATAKCLAEKKERTRLLKRLEQQKLDWERKAELALDKEREDLARAALAEKTALGDRIQHISDELSMYDEQLTKYDDDIARLQAKLNDARARQRAIVMRHRSAHHQLKSRKQIHNSKIDDMLNRFDSAERRIDHIESEAEALDMGRKAKSLDEEIEQLQRDERVEAELDALKSSRKEKQWDTNIMSDLLFVPVILFLVIVAPIWLILHYATRNSASKRLTSKDESLLEDLHENARRMEERIHNLERILDADAPEWRSKS